MGLAFSRVVFFFQAEDGIRYYKVTGVQTCALPISSRRRHTRLQGDWSSDVCSSDLTAQHFSSAIFAYGSSTGLVSRLAAASRKWNGTNTWPRATRSEIRHE